MRSPREMESQGVRNEALECILTATEGVRTEPLHIPTILEKCLAFGFTSCRYYDVALASPNEPTLILTAVKGDIKASIGFRVPLRNSTLGQATNHFRPADVLAGTTMISTEIQ